MGKQFEVIICSTLGIGEREYYGAMINLDLEIEETSKYPGTEQQQQMEARDRVEQLKMEKREAMDYCEKKNVLSTGAAESMQRRLQGGGSPAAAGSASFYDIGHPKTPWPNGGERPSSPVSSSHPSQVPTLWSIGQTWGTTSSDSPTLYATAAVPSPCGVDPATACEPAPSPTDTWQTVPSTTSEHGIPDDLPTGMVPINSPTRRNDDEDGCIYRDMRQQFSAGLSIFEDPAARETEHHHHHHHHSRWISQAHTPARKPVPLRSLAAQSTPNLLLGSSSPNRSTEVLASPGGTQVFGPPSPLTPRSMYPEPPPFPPPPPPQPPLAQVGTVRRQSRVGGRSKKRSWSLQLDKSIPPLAQGRGSRLAENAPEPVTGHVRSHSASGMRDEPVRSRTYRCRTPQQPRFTPLPPIADIGSEPIPGPVRGGPLVDYEMSPIEMPYKLHTKDSCFGTFISADAKHALFLSPHSFQVFAVPTPEQAPQLKPKFQYRLGEWEGLKKSKVRWQYKTAAVSDRYVVTITKERVRRLYYLARDSWLTKVIVASPRPRRRLQGDL